MSLGSLSGAQLASAGRPPSATVLGAAQARSAGLGVAVIRHRDAAGELIVVRLPRPAGYGPAPAGAEGARREALRLLDSAPDGSLAIADQLGDPQAGLTLARPDGGLVHSALVGVAGAAFAPDASWVAAIDGGGRLWRVDAASGVARALGAGPYSGALSFARSGELLLVDVSSAEAPFSSGVVRLDPRTGHVQRVEGDPGFVFSAQQLTDGSIAVVMHVFGGGVEVRRFSTGSQQTIAVLDPRAIDPSVSADGSRVAYAVGEALFVHDVGPGRVGSLGAGALPRLAPDGRSLLALRGGRTVVLAHDGTELDRFEGATAIWARCAGGCRS